MAEEKILVIDDDEDLREIIRMYLESSGYQVVAAEDGISGLKVALSEKPDLIILDMMLPGMDGIEVCQEIRRQMDTPILFLSCKSSAEEKSIGLIAGGDDYISKPFEPIELIARVKAHLRRNRMLGKEPSLNNSKDGIISYGALDINKTRFTVFINNQEVILSPKEFKILSFFAENPYTVFSNEQIFQALWGTQSYGDNRTVLVHISNLRKKLENIPDNPIYIQTVKGVGYKLCSVSEPSSE